MRKTPAHRGFFCAFLPSEPPWTITQTSERIEESIESRRPLVIPMSEIIVCPRCQRRLQLPADFQAELVRCPSCATTFPAASASPVPSSVQTTLPTPPQPPEQPLPERLPQTNQFQRSTGKPCLIVALVLGAGVLLTGCGVAVLVAILWHMQPPRMNPVARVEEDEEERREQLRQAFKDRKPLAEDEIARQVKALFDELGTALRAQAAAQIQSKFDLDRMMDELDAAGGGALRLRTAKERRDFRPGLSQGIGQSLAQRGEVFHWIATDIRHVKKLNNDEAVVISRHKHTNGMSLKMRWWMTRRNGDWKIYDFEDLDMASRFSSEIAVLLGQGLGRAAEIGRTVKSIVEAIQAVIQEDLDGAEKKLAQVQGIPLPPRQESLRQLANALVLLHRGNFADALKALDEAQRLHADLPLADFLRGIALNRLGKADQALKHLTAYRDLLGEDGEVCREVAEALREQHRFDEAAQEYRKSLDFNPKDGDAFLGLLRSIGPDSNKDDIGPRFAKLDNRRANFDVCAEDCEEREFPELLDPLVQTMRKLDPQYPPLDYYQALLHARMGQPDEAVRSLKSALGKQTEEQQRLEYERHFLKAMASAGHYRKAYAVATRTREAFRFLAAEAAKRYQLDKLKQLLSAHTQKEAEDPLLALYRAEIQVRTGEYEKADKAFTAALARRPDAETLQTFRASRVLARYHSGQVMSAYRDIGPREETFTQLATLLFEDDRDDQLQDLLDAHAKDFPNSIEMLRFRYRLLVRRNKTAEGIALFKSTLAKAKEKEKRSQLASEFLWDMLAAGKLMQGYQAAPSAAEAFRQMAEGLLDDGRWDDLRHLLEAHRAGHADDPWLAYYQAEVHQENKAWDKAATILRAALKRDPKNARESIQTNYVFVMYKAGQWQRAYAEIEPHNKTFTQLANLMANDKKGVELEALIRVHKPNARDDPDLPFYEARAKVLTKKWAEAVPLFRKAYQKQKDQFARASHQSYFLMDLAAEGRCLEGYRAAMDKSAALNTLGGRLVSQKKDKELAEVLEEHHKGGGGEPWYSFYLGELDLLRGEVRQASRHFAAALAKGKPQEQWRLRDGLFRARVRAGDAVIAYEEHKTNEGTFLSLAQLCNQNKDIKQLQALLDTHRKDKPDDPSLVSWELKLLWLRKDYEGALRFLTQHREDVFSQPQFRWQAEDYRVRSFVKLKRHDEAVRAAKDIVKKRSGDRLLLVLAHAAAGDVPQTIAAMEKPAKDAFFLRRCYEDDDLGPILRSKDFQAFRAKFPQPKEDKAASGE